ncbi:MAG TPA: AAC(3) family N-acetyltransferase [Armatimonadota bacterium]|nr:AAC(3) family N-acetyltransferase [Armatimonadota bacterium]HQK94091.1 AAC(3) family N-acetyltransferase [Armatimonadota bacterium]
MDQRDAAARIAEGLIGAGVRSGGTVLVHSSLKSLGRVPGGPETVILGLLEAIGPEGTLLLPALSYATVHAANPVFDVRRTPSCVGAIPEYFRTRPGTLRSVSPTHSVCGVGPRAEELLAKQQLDDTPCGPHSAFRALPDIGGQIVMLGCGLAPNTSMHAVEEVAEAPYLFGATVEYRVVLFDGRETRLRVRRHAFAGWRQRYERLAWILPPEALRAGPVLEATAHVIEAAVMWPMAVETIGREPYYFVEREERS